MLLILAVIVPLLDVLGGGGLSTRPGKRGRCEAPPLNLVGCGNERGESS